MRRTDKLTAFVELANAAALPVTGKRGQAFELADDGTGKPAIAIWDSGASSWAIISIGGGSALAWQNPVEDKDVTDPSTLTPSAGERWIVATGGVGLWSGKDNDIAEWDGVQWDFATPTEGFACEVLDEDQFYAYTGTAWVILPDFLGAVSGTPPSTDHAIARYDGITGLNIQDSGVTIADNGDVDLGGASANITATQTIALDDHYGIAELDANPVAAGAKIDKIIGTDHAIVRSDGITGDVQDSGVTIDDNGNIDMAGASANITATQTIALDDHYAIAALDGVAGVAGAKIDKVNPTTAGNLAELDAAGELVDSGVATTAVALEADFKTGRQAIGAAATTVVVAFGAAYADTNYSITFTLLNVTDVAPAHFTMLITTKAVGGFTVTLSGPTATVNYVLEWSTKHD